MTVQIPDPGTGNGQTGDDEYVFRKKVRDNFSDQSNAASRLVGTAAGNVMEVGAFGLGSQVAGSMPIFPSDFDAQKTAKTGIYQTSLGTVTGDGQLLYLNRGYWLSGISFPIAGAPKYISSNTEMTSLSINDFLIKGINATTDSNGFIKGASPIVDMYDNRIDLNHDAIAQGDITFEKLGVGDYLVKGSLGFAQEGWYIETPKDANGNVLVAVVYKQLGNNDLSIKTYAKKFDDETGDIVANLLKPRDIPTGRFISLRLHELPKEPPVMPMDEPTTEV